MGDHLHVAEVGPEDVHAGGVGRSEDQTPGKRAEDEEDEEAGGELGGGQVAEEVEDQEDHAHSQQDAVDHDVVVAGVLDLHVDVHEGGDAGREERHPHQPPEKLGSGQTHLPPLLRLAKQDLSLALGDLGGGAEEVGSLDVEAAAESVLVEVVVEGVGEDDGLEKHEDHGDVLCGD